VHSQGSRVHGTLQEAERAHILATVKETKWVVSGPQGAAARLARHVPTNCSMMLLSSSAASNSMDFCPSTGFHSRS
jgi:hypothetical protein